ncbi:sodium/hydrogen exchanger 6 [Tanacetum coccineum]
MFSIASWNIRGLNRSPKQKKVRQVVNENNLSVCAILESHIDVAVVFDTCKKVCSRWKWTSNWSLYSKDSQIILGWNDDLVDVMIMAQTNQVMHVRVNTRVDNKTLFCSFVYADNYYIDRRVLWSNLVGHAGLMRNRPWVLLGDFNATLNLEDHSSGGYESNIAMRDFKDCVQAMEVSDDGFLEIVESGWNVNIEFFAMYHVVKRLKGLKSPFCKLLHEHGNLHERVNRLRVELDEAQKAIDRDPSSSMLREEHAHYLLAFKEAQLNEERFLKNRIEMVSDASNMFYDGNHVPDAFVSHYNQFFGAEGDTTPLDDHDLYIRTLDNAKADFMVRNVTNEEIKSVIFSMRDDKAPGLDGFTAAFFKKAWDVVGGDITCVLHDFFSNGKLLKELNHTSIALIPMVTTPARINDYRPISCCNVLYKCISKIIVDRVKEGLGDIVSINQSAFVPGHRISNNILLTQELMRNYHKKRGPPRCAFKVDIQKAYDTIDWKFLENILVGFGFHPKMVHWIMVSRLVPSIPKSTSFFCNVPNAIKASILNSMPFAEGEMKKGKAKVAWDSVCLPKLEGGLGIRRIDDFNVALMATHIWCILTHKESLWVKWVHTYKLKGRSFWDVP